MPSQACPLGEWLPDNPGSGLAVATNVFSTQEGKYIPVKGPQAVTVPLFHAFCGGAAFVASDGTSILFGTTFEGHYKYTGTTWAGIVNVPSSNPTRFAQFGDIVMMTCDTAVRAYRMTGSIGSYVPTDGPVLTDVAQVRDFVMGITTDNALQWSQFNDAMTWTTGANQADKQPSLWGKLMRIVGGEYMIALTQNSVIRGTYVGVEGGLDIIFQFDEISQEVGCMAEGSVCNVGRLVFFLSERGFMMCDGQEVTPIADEKFNRWFFKTYSRADIAGIWAAVDPRASVVMWAMPGSPGRIIAYNWVLKRASVIQADVQGLFTAYTAGSTLEALDATYPSGLDTVPISLDDPSLQGGNPILLLAGTDDALYALTGDNMEATLQVDNIEPTPGRRSRIREVRLISDTLSASVTIDARMRMGDEEAIRSASTMRLNGKLPIRANGRYNTLAITIPQGTDWTFVQGCELEFDPGDAR